MRLTVSDTLEGINKNKDQKVVLEQLKKQLDNPRIVDLFNFWLNPEFKWDLPEGEAPFKPNIPHGTEMLLWSELRRLYIFTNRLKPDLKEARRQQLFVELLEAVHPSDANMLVQVKDQNWPYKNIKMETLKEAFPQVTVPEKKKAAA